MKIKKKTLKKVNKLIIITLIIGLLGYFSYYSIHNYKEGKINETVSIINEYCKTTWQEYINTEVAPLMTSYIANNCTCFYEGQYVKSDHYDSMCVCSCYLYELNGTLITTDFRPLYSTINE